VTQLAGIVGTGVFLISSFTVHSLNTQFSRVSNARAYLRSATAQAAHAAARVAGEEPQLYSGSERCDLTPDGKRWAAILDTAQPDLRLAMNGADARMSLSRARVQNGEQVHLCLKLRVRCDTAHVGSLACGESGNLEIESCETFVVTGCDQE